VYIVEGRARRDYTDCRTVLAQIDAEVSVLPFIQEPAELVEKTRDADALVVVGTRVTREVLGALERLQVVVRPGVGYDVVDVVAATELGVVVVHVPDLWVREVATHTLGLMLALARKLPLLDREVRSGVWRGNVPGDHVGSIYGETVGIVGLGNIGSAFARRVSALETRVVACDPYVDDARFAALGVDRVSLDELAACADYVSLHVPLTGETRHIVSDGFLNRMKRTAMLINTSRGAVVDEAALIRALHDHRIAGAALDVWETEPPAHDNPLLAMDQVLASPHAAYFSSPAIARLPCRAGEEILRVLAGDPPLFPVNPEAFAPGAFRRSRRR
jgi:D-3-phosphoglycerate dehydrogenase